MDLNNVMKEHIVVYKLTNIDKCRGGDGKVSKEQS